MLRIRYFGLLLTSVLSALLCVDAFAQAPPYPTKTVRIVVPVPPGGGVDTLARIVAEELQLKWGRPVIVDNRAGAGGNIGAELVYAAPPDGHTLLFTAGGLLVINRFLYSKLQFDPDAFVPVSIVANSGSILVVNPKVAANTVGELIALAKQKPDSLDYASPGVGTGSHLTAELFNAMASIRLTHIPYRGTSPALTDVLGGRVGVMFGEVGSVLPHIKAGNLRALAVTGAKRNPSLPDTPTVAETLPGFLATPWNGVAAPPKTPDAVATFISAAIANVVKQPNIAARLTERNFEVVASTPSEMKQFVTEETGRWQGLIEALRKNGSITLAN